MKGIKRIGKIKQKNKIKYCVLKTKKGYYPSAHGVRLNRVGDRHRTAKGARKVLTSWIKNG